MSGQALSSSSSGLAQSGKTAAVLPYFWLTTSAILHFNNNEGIWTDFRRVIELVSSHYALRLSLRAKLYETSTFIYRAFAFRCCKTRNKHWSQTDNFFMSRVADFLITIYKTFSQLLAKMSTLLIYDRFAICKKRLFLKIFGPSHAFLGVLYVRGILHSCAIFVLSPVATIVAQAIFVCNHSGSIVTSQLQGLILWHLLYHKRLALVANGFILCRHVTFRAFLVEALENFVKVFKYSAMKDC